jgi:hypothetical protein
MAAARAAQYSAYAATVARRRAFHI